MDSTVMQDSGTDSTVPQDSGGMDTGMDTGIDSGMDSSVLQDTGVDVADEAMPEDAPADVTDASPALHPCITPGDTNCVQCANNTKAGANGITVTGQCTTTEARFVQHDINTGKATAAGKDPPGSCYACLAAKGCLDQTKLSTTGHECDDTSTITTGTEAQCLAVVDCILGSSCSLLQTSDCYCGTAPALTTCSATPSAANGVCDTQIAAGIGVPVTDGVTISGDFTITSSAGGMADQIFNCGVNGNCTACLQ